MATFHKAITSKNGDIELSVVMSSSGKWIPPSLNWFCENKNLQKPNENYYWDNDVWVKQMLRSIKKRKKNRYTKELKSFCIEHDLDFGETKKILLDIYKQSKKHNFWNNEK